MTPDEPVSLDKLDWRVSGLERDLRDFRTETSKQLERISTDVRTLTFVREDVYQSDQRTTSAQIEAAMKVARAANTIAMTVLGLLCTIIVAGIFTALFRLAG